ncbi:long-chain fatty acid--CoA ligase [Saccharopolyspora rosea]|uniref:Long-chain fatty acid--CoA ligase n=1 Tax=Saccharopolyspora rosea TaxID=524884 RepID=A0ABW3FZ36_9PSEU
MRAAMRNHGIGSWPARQARSRPGAAAVVHRDRTRSYAELAGRAQAVARLLLDLGVERGDRVAYLGPNHPGFLATLFGAGLAGAVFVPLNTRHSDAELAFALRDADAAVLVHDPRHAASARALATGGLRTVDVAELDGLPGGEPVDEPVDLDDLAMILYTSGTTGRPKGAMLTHGNLTWNALNVLVDVDITSEEVTLVSAPLFHTAALGMTCLPTLLKGGAVLLEESFDPDRTLDLVERHRVTCLFGVPTMFDALSRSARWAEADLGSVRFLLCGGAPVPPDLLRRYRARGLAIRQGYGLTEASPSVLLQPQGDERVGSAGAPAFFTDVRLRTPEGQPPEPGAPGELQVRGANVVRGYWQRPDADPRTADGWLRTGDVATADDDGHYRVVDRLKDMFISGGENVYPAEVEAVLREHPGVVDAAVVGLPDPVWGETGRAVVVARPGVTERELLDFARERLAGYKVPKSVRFADALPRNPTGKLDKRALREQEG